MAQCRLGHRGFGCAFFALVATLPGYLNYSSDGLEGPASGAGSETRYGVVFDAGSSGSRVHVYSYRTGGEAGEFELVQDLLKKVKPGLSSYAHDPVAAAFSLTGLLRYAEEKVPQSEHSRTPLFLMASAGLRAIKQDDAAAILKSVRTLFRSSPFRFEDDWAYIMSGKEEGVFGWVTVNYLLNALDDKSRSRGVIDLGGGSVQLVYHMPQGVRAHQDYSGEVLHGGKKHDLYVGTFAGYGLDHARDRLLESLKTDAADTAEHPCVASGHKIERKSKDGAMQSFIGTGSFKDCAARYRALFDKTVACGSPPCRFAGVFQPAELPVRIFGFSYLYDRTSAIGLLDGKVQEFGIQSMTIQDIEKAAEAMCSLPPSDAAARFADVEDAKKWDNFCGDAAYLAVLLEHGFGIDRSMDLTMGNKLGATEIVWTLGAIIAKSGALKAQEAEKDRQALADHDGIYPELAKMARQAEDQAAGAAQKQEL